MEFTRKSSKICLMRAIQFEISIEQQSIKKHLYKELVRDSKKRKGAFLKKMLKNSPEVKSNWSADGDKSVTLS